MEIHKIDLGNNSYFIGEELIIGKNFKIGKNTVLRAKKAVIGDYVSIGDNNDFLVGEEILFGDCSFIGNNNNFTSRKINFGKYLFFDSNVTVGHGGKFNYDSYLIVGDNCMICAHVKLNVNYNIKIGDNVGIGEYVDVWTHGSYLPILDGFPSQFGPVLIGNNVWIPAKSTIMPNIVIGNDVVLGVNSLVNKDLPSGSLCAGIPAKVIRENAFPKELLIGEKQELIKNVIEEYTKLTAFKEIKFSYSFDFDNLEVTFNDIIFNFNNYEINGELDEISEDFRDFLRRRGMKFFTGKPFSSILPPAYKRLLDF